MNGDLGEIDWRESAERTAARRRIRVGVGTAFLLVVLAMLFVWTDYETADADARATRILFDQAKRDEYFAEVALRSAPSGEQGALRVAYDQTVARSNQAFESSLRAASRAERAHKVLWVGLVGCLLLTLATGVGARTYMTDTRRDYSARVRLRSIEAEARRRASKQPGDPLGLIALWEGNRTRIEGYHELVTSYATATRHLTQIVLVVGFGFLLLTSTVALFARTTASAVATSVVATAGAALGGFVANAVLRNAESSAREVQAFFGHPLHLERLLSAERLLADMPPKERAQAKLALIVALAGSQPPVT